MKKNKLTPTRPMPLTRSVKNNPCEIKTSTSASPRPDCSWNEATSTGNINQRTLIVQKRIGKYCQDARDANE